VRDLVMAFLEDELVRCCVTHHRARDIEVRRSRSMSPARVTRQRRQSRRIVWDDRARMRAVVISELEAIRLVYVSLRMGRVSSLRPNVRMAAVVISELEVGQFAYVNRRIGRMRSIVGLRERMKRVIGRVLVVDVRIGARVMVQLAGMGAAVISQLGAGRFESVDLGTAYVSSMGHSRWGVVVVLRERMKRVIGRVLVVDVRIGARVMVQLAGMGAAVISQLGAGRFDSVNLTTA